MSDPIENLLHQTMGLDASTIGSASIQRAVAARMAACRLTDREAYRARLADVTGGELQELIEAIVVPETWFFRDREAFTALARVASESLISGRKLHLLSVPCSTGEEPYSMAMTLLDAGLPADGFSIDAMDISERAVARARHFLYGKNSFRGADLAFRDRHFVPTEGNWRLKAPIRRQVRFHVRNLLAGDALPGDTAYDIIFCRNLLIYFDRPTQDRALSLLARRLTPQGRLFVGPSETALLMDHGFLPVNIPHSFAFQPPGARPRKTPPALVPLPIVRKPAVVTKPRWPAALPPLPVAPATAPQKKAATASASDLGAELQAVRQLADRGELDEATKLCTRHLKTHGPSAEAYYLLGLVHDAGERHAEAVEFYRKAIYLDPVHHEALVQLALLREREGDHPAAKVLNERARKAAQRVTK